LEPSAAPAGSTAHQLHVGDQKIDAGNGRRIVPSPSKVVMFPDIAAEMDDASIDHDIDAVRIVGARPMIFITNLFKRFMSYKSRAMLHAHH
jgi:hypothetical protein